MPSDPSAHRSADRTWPDGLRRAMGEGLHRLPTRLHKLLPPEQRTDLRHLLGRYHPWEEGADLTPPATRPGEVTGPPDFVGVGVEMAGTEWWYQLIADHPGVSSCPELPRGRHYLSHFCTRPFGPEQVAEYHRWFPRTTGTITGEWTPSYSSHPWVPPLVARAAPEARLLVMMRDPVDRALLGLAHSADGRGPHVGSHSADAIDRGFYGRQLRSLLAYFPADRILTLQYEQCVADPAGRLAATYRFLGVDEGHRPAGLRGPDPGADLVPEVDGGVRDRLAGIYAADVADLATLVSDLDLSLWPGVDGVAPH